MKQNTVRTFINRNVERQLVREYLLKETERAGFISADGQGREGVFAEGQAQPATARGLGYGRGEVGRRERRGEVFRHAKKYRGHQRQWYGHAAGRWRGDHHGDARGRVEVDGEGNGHGV